MSWLFSWIYTTETNIPCAPILTNSYPNTNSSYIDANEISKIAQNKSKYLHHVEAIEVTTNKFKCGRDHLLEALIFKPKLKFYLEKNTPPM